MPALAITRSSAPPDSSSARWMAATSASVSCTSSGTGTMFPFSACSRFSSSLRRAAAKTLPPSFAKCSASPRPIPPDAPVTKTLFMARVLAQC